MRDENEPDIIEHARGRGCLVHRLSPPTPREDGLPDLLCATPEMRRPIEGQWITGRVLFVVEVKRNTGPPSSRKLRKSQVDWHREWYGVPLFVVDNVKAFDEALDEVMGHR